MRAGVDLVLASFFVHGDDALFPLRVGAGNPEPDVRNDL